MTLEEIFNQQNPELPGAHSNAGFISKEYDEKIVNEQVEFLKESESWSKAKMERWQLKKIRSLLIHAQNTVPYYRKLFSNNNYFMFFIIRVNFRFIST